MQTCISVIKRLSLFIIILLQIKISFCQGTVKPIVPNYNGDTVIITGRIYAGNFLKNVITKPTFLNVYDSNPMQMIMIRIDSNDRKNFPTDPEKYYLNKKVSIRGVLGDYKGITSIKINAPSYVEIDENDNGPEPITSTGSYMSGQEFGFGKSDSIFRHKQDSIAKILANDPYRKDKKNTPNYQTAESVLESHEKNKATEEKNAEVVANEQKDASETTETPADKNEEQKTEPEKNTETTEAVETDTAYVTQPEETKEENAEKPTIKTDTKSAVIDTAARSGYLKTISNQEFVTVNELWEVKEGEIEMRTSPTTDSPVLAYLMKKMTIRITNRSKKWSYVTVENPDGTIGLSGFIKNKTYKQLGHK